MNNAWDNDPTWESNKQEVPSHDVHASGASIDIPITTPPAAAVTVEEHHRNPSLSRCLIRCWQCLASIGALGFQVGATSFSGEEIPFGKAGLLYYGHVISCLSILWSAFNIFVYLTRRFGTGHKIKRFLSTLFDLTLTALFGVCVFYEIATYRCKPGMHNGWCDFYNTGIFFLMSLFLTYTVHALWDLFGAMDCLRR
ncbi:hypothetical protein INT47_003155 [Mucor saturninus]|uniref:MARVEL domain-containing protein n=1 Tax=Mucor saturninus TaxID=64648 RepID=A0A8H7QZ45_9FUNG|nr:hypothetical protein INT47_003155 [Mucor saturninus]